jgi:hypothetical protein
MICGTVLQVVLSGVKTPHATFENRKLKDPKGIYPRGHAALA